MTFTARHVRRMVTGVAAVALTATALIAPPDRSETASAIGATVAAPGGVSTGLSLWLDASNPAGTGTTPADGTEITTWKDLSGSSKDATVNPNGVGGANTGAYFSAAPAGFNGRPALRFERGADKFGSVYESSTLDMRATNRPDVTVVAVYQQTSDVGVQGIWGIDNGNWDRFFLTRFNSANGLVGLGPVPQPDSGLYGQPVTGSGSPGATKLMTVGYSGNVVNGVNVGDPGESFVYFDCALETTFTDTTHATDAQSTLSIGWDGDTSAFGGYIAEMIVYDRVLTTPELESVNGYLASKYGLGSGCATFACDLSAARTLSQGGWSTTSASNPMTEVWFDANIGDDLKVGGASGSVTLSSAANVKRFLPTSGTPAVLRSNLTNPTRRQVKNTLAGQATALTLNIARNPDMGGAVLTNGYSGTVSDLLAEINAALNGTGSPSKSRLSSLNGLADFVNLSFPNGVDQGRVVCAGSDS